MTRLVYSLARLRVKKAHGACQPLVPHIPVMLLSPTKQVCPKSVITMRWLAEGVVAQRMFSSFRSRWTSPLECM